MDASAELDELDGIRVEFIAGSLASALSRPIIGQAFASHLDLLAEVSSEGACRILRAPAVCEAIRLKDPWQLVPAVRAEIVFDLCPNEHIESWTALGDAWLGNYPPDAVPVRLSRDVNGRLRGPSMATGIPVDLATPLVPSHPAAGFDKTCDLSAAIDDATIAKLDEAARLVEAISPAAWSAIRRFTANLVLRQDGRSPHVFRSASSAAAIGRCVLVNVGSPGTTPADIAEGLVHETVHALASCAELEQPLLRRADCASGEIPSPWTGAILQQHAFIHACLVWFAIQRFWQAALAARLLFRHAARRAEEIRSGFFRLDLSACRGATAAALMLLTDLKESATAL